MPTEAARLQLPESVEAERAILGAILIDNSRVFEVAAELQPEDFARDAHRILFAHMLRLSDAGKPLDIVSLTAELGAKNEILKVGGAAYVSDLTTGIVNTAALARHVEIVRDKSQRRRLIRACELATARVADPTMGVADCSGQLEEALLEIQGARSEALGPPVGKIAPDVVEELHALRHRTDEVIGLSTGISSLDRNTTGIRQGELWVVGALPSRGKSVLGVQIAATNAKAGVPTLMFSLEMSARQVVRRIIPGESDVPAERIRDPRSVSNREWQSIVAAAAEISGWPLYIDDAEELSARELMARARLNIRRHGIRLVIVDYLQEVQAPGKEVRERVAAASNALRKLAKSEQVAVVALSQLSRPKDRDENHIPSMIDLRESGSIEAHAHTVLLLYRPKRDGEWSGEDQVILAKQREGLVGWEPVLLDGRRLRFVERVAESR